MKYKIERGIAIPERRRVVHRQEGEGFYALVGKMKVGDSAIIQPVDQASSSDVAKRHGVQVITRSTDDGIRIWRVA